MNLIALLTKPYPYRIFSKSDTFFYIGLGVFVALFLIVFQPFGIAIWNTPYKIIKLAGYGLVSFTMPMLLLFIRSIFINERKAEYHYKIWNELLWLVAIIGFVGFGCLVHSYLIGISDLSLKGFVISLGMVIPIGFFPVIASVWIKYNRYIDLNKKEADIIEDAISHTENNILDDNKLHFTAENEKDNLSIPAKSLLFIESMDNYSQFVYTENNKVTKTLLRGSLKFFETQVDSSDIVRCHRSFIVNLSNAQHIEGNAQGYLLSMLNIDQKVPVSRGFGPAIKAYFTK